jgi:hypothetical protein
MEHTSIVTTGSPESSAFPAQWFYGLFRAPRRRIRLVTVLGGLTILREPGRARKTSADLTPATGARTTRLHRPLQHRSSARRYRSRAEARPAIRHAPDAAASTASRPNVRDDGQRPFQDGTAEISGGDLPDGTSEIFLRGGPDDPNQLESPHEIPVLAHAICTPESLRKRGDIGKIELICRCLADHWRNTRQLAVP